MKMAQCFPTDEIFTHIEESEGGIEIVHHINASAMFREASSAIERGIAEVVETFFEPEFVEFIRERRGVEQHKIDRLCEPYLSMPCLGFWMPDGSCLTVDGHHRIVKNFEAGEKTYKIVVFDYEFLDYFCVDDIPEDFSAFLADETKEQSTVEETKSKIILLH